MTFARYRCETKDGDRFVVKLKGITYIRDGKILLEQGEWILEYFEHHIHLQPNSIAKYVKISIE